MFPQDVTAIKSFPGAVEKAGGDLSTHVDVKWSVEQIKAVVVEVCNLNEQVQ